MTPEQVVELSRSFADGLRAAQSARRSQSFAALSESVHATTQLWNGAKNVAQSFRSLEVDWSAIRGEVRALREASVLPVQELVSAPEELLASKPPNVLSGVQQNAKVVIERLGETWTVWAENKSSGLSWLQPLLEKVDELRDVSPELNALVRGLPRQPPVSDKELQRCREWLERRDALLEKIEQVLDANVAEFLRGALAGGAWLDALNEASLKWLSAHGLAPYLKVSFSSVPNPNPIASDASAGASGGSDWD